MSNRPLEPRSFDLKKAQNIAGLSLENKSEEDLHTLFQQIMKKGLHGLCFSIYEEGQEPGHIISKEQVRRRLEVIRPYTTWVRSFSCIEGNEWIPIVAKELGMKTLVGAWLGDDEELNQKELAALIDLSKQGVVDIAAVGNEVLYRDDLNEQELLAYSIYTDNQVLPPSVRVVNEEFNGLTAHWAELIVGVKTEVLNNLYISVNVQLKRKLSEDRPENFNNLYIPGFNSTNDFSEFGAGYGYSVSYLIPLFQK